MCLRTIILGFVLLLAVCLSGCSGGNEPVNEGKDRPQKAKTT
jgi:PBP1b-binding outer membrane lipoprotein LpoB